MSTASEPLTILAEPAAMKAPPSRLAEFWHYFSENNGAVAGLVVICLVVLAAILAGVIAPHGPTVQYRDEIGRAHV